MYMLSRPRIDQRRIVLRKDQDADSKDRYASISEDMVT